MDSKQKIAQTDTDSTTTTVRYQISDHLGSATFELDENAEIISYEEYYPFGSTSYRSGRSETEVSQKRYKYVMKELDNETGLYYYGMRYYASWIARFVSVDPLQHKYPYYTPFQYAGNKPITFIDLDGAEEGEPENNNNVRVGSVSATDFVWTNSPNDYNVSVNHVKYQAFKSPKGVHIFFIGDGTSIGIMGPNMSYFRQYGYANDSYGTTYFASYGHQITAGTKSNIAVGVDIDVLEVGYGYYWGGNSFDVFYNYVQLTTVSYLPVDISFGKNYLQGTVGISRGYAVSRIFSDDILSYSFTYSENENLTKKDRYIIISDFEIRNNAQKENFQQGELFFNGEKTGIIMYADKGSKMWKSENYIKKQKSVGKKLKKTKNN